MCQLLGMNCATPTDFNFSFRGFARRGGDTDKHSHGWGMAIYEGCGLRTFLDPLPAADSRVAAFVESYPIQTLNMMAHIRYATQGAVSLENVHPFQREMWGIQWCFAHNGEVPKFTTNNTNHQNNPGNNNPQEQKTSSTAKGGLLLKSKHPQEVFYHPVGNTDSEATFCAILNALRAEFTELPTLPVLYETLQRLCTQIVEGEEENTILNFLLGCGQYTLFAYSWPGSRPGSGVWNGLYYTIRKPPFHKAKLVDCDYSVDFAQCTTASDRVAVIATSPLTANEEWVEFKRGELRMFDNGLAYSELYDCHEVEEQGRGLFSRTIPRQSSANYSQYNIPSQLRKLVDNTVMIDREEDVVRWARTGADLGCGSGCSGKAFRSCVRHLTGVDLSPEMIDKARERGGIYDELVLGNVECVLRKKSVGPKRCKNPAHGALAYRKFDLIFACNVFVYVQDLRNVFCDIRQILGDNGGVFAFSAEFIDDEDSQSDDPTTTTTTTTTIEEKEDSKDSTEQQKEQLEPYVLQSCARYAHKRWYLEQSAKEFGFVTKAFEPSPLQRTHAGKDVYGVLVVLTTTATTATTTTVQ